MSTPVHHFETALKAVNCIIFIDTYHDKDYIRDVHNLKYAAELYVSFGVKLFEDAFSGIAKKTS